jgi:hypothetical protein
MHTAAHSHSWNWHFWQAKGREDEDEGDQDGNTDSKMVIFSCLPHDTCNPTRTACRLLCEAQFAYLQIFTDFIKVIYQLKSKTAFPNYSTGMHGTPTVQAG